MYSLEVEVHEMLRALQFQDCCNRVTLLAELLMIRQILTSLFFMG